MGQQRTQAAKEGCVEHTGMGWCKSMGEVDDTVKEGGRGDGEGRQCRHDLLGFQKKVPEATGEGRRWGRR